MADKECQHFISTYYGVIAIGGYCAECSAPLIEDEKDRDAPSHNHY